MSQHQIRDLLGDLNASVVRALHVYTDDSSLGNLIASSPGKDDVKHQCCYHLSRSTACTATGMVDDVNTLSSQQPFSLPRLRATTARESAIGS